MVLEPSSPLRTEPLGLQELLVQQTLFQESSLATNKDDNSHIESLMIQCSMDKWKSIVAGQTVCGYFRKSKATNQNHSFFHLGQLVSNNQWHVNFHVNCEK